MQISQVHLNQWSSSKKEAKYVGHDVIADHNRDGNNKPREQITVLFYKHTVGEKKLQWTTIHKEKQQRKPFQLVSFTSVKCFRELVCTFNKVN